MALSSELHEVLARRHRPRPREVRLGAQLEESGDISVGEDPDGVIDPDDRSQADITTRIDITLEVPPALPPPQPSWSFLCDRAGASVSVLLARSVLESVGCYLGIHPPANTLLAVAKCRSAGTVRQLLRDVYGERGLDAAYQLAGILQPPKSVESQSVPSRNGVTAGGAIDPSLLTALPGMPRRLANWMLRPPEAEAPPPWRSETVGEREQREALEALGGWPGV